MFRNSKLSTIMTTDLVTVNSQELFTEIDKIFKANNFHHIPVVDNGKLLGIISKSDYLLLVEPLSFFRKELEEYKNQRFFSSLLAENVMTKNLVCLGPEDSVSDAAKVFSENQIHAIPIVEQKEKLLGIVTTLDLINHAYLQQAIAVSA